MRSGQAGGPASSGIFAIEGEAQICKQKEACVARGMLFHRELRRQQSKPFEAVAHGCLFVGCRLDERQAEAADIVTKQV